MAFRVSPGVDVNEIDLTLGVTAVNTTRGALAGAFKWGPVDQAMLIDSETNYAKYYFKPSNFNAETWFTGASFLAYGSSMYVSRAANTTAAIPTKTVSIVSGNSTITVVGNTTSDLSSGMKIISSGKISSSATITNIINSTAFSISSGSLAVTTGSDDVVFMSNVISFNSLANTSTVSNMSIHTIKNEKDFEDKVGTFDSDVKFIARYPGSPGDSLKVSICGSANGFSEELSLVGNNSASTLSINVNSNTATILALPEPSYANVSFNANSSIDSNTGFITVTHEYSDGDVILYDAQGGTVVGGLTDGLSYYVFASNTSGFKVSSNNTGAISITASGVNETQFFSRTDIPNESLVNTDITAIINKINVSDYIAVGDTDIGYQYMKVASIDTPSVNTTTSVGTTTIHFEDVYKLSTNYSSNTTFTRNWEYFSLVDKAPGQSDYQISFGNSAINSDEIHVVVADVNGKFTGTPGAVLEIYKAVSRATDSKTLDGTKNYWKDVINDSSQYVWAISDISGLESSDALNLTNAVTEVAILSFNYGQDGRDETSVPVGTLAKAYDVFKNAEEIDISLIMSGKSNSFILGNYLIDNIAETRKDAIVFVSPPKGSVVNNSGFQASAIVEFRNSLRNSSYGFLDSGYKYMYDKYNDIYRWIPLNGDMAGLVARTENTNDAWWSPGGFNRGQLKNVVKLAYSPSEADRNVLYKADINPVVTFPGQGTILYGDKTLLGKESAFSRINVRRLFIVVEKAIATASRFLLFEFNDEFTRATFRNLVTPYLTSIKGKRGITDFTVVCDSTNNTADVIDNNQFVGSVFIKPARSINFITLNFVAVSSSATFSEVIGSI